MLHRFIGLTAVLLLAACASVERTPEAQPLLVIRDVTVIDVTPGAAELSLPGRTVTVAGGRIQSVVPAAEARTPRGARIVEGRGRFLIPGLWDAHTHLSTFGESALPLWSRRASPRFATWAGVRANCGRGASRSAGESGPARGSCLRAE
jgi:N-acyl-D-aspartate/D-glutamate deacylase